MKPIQVLAFAVMGVLLLATPAAAEPAPVPQAPTDFQITLGGEVGVAAEANMTRFRSAPFDSVPWLRADLTSENAAEFDKIVNGGMPFRPFKNYSGDISGRFIEIMALNAQASHEENPAFRELLKEVPKHQRAGGYFCASGEITWQQPIDRTKDGESNIMMPALWGNARILCGLIEACRAFPENKEILATTIKLGDFYAGIVPRFTDPARMTEYISGTSYASGYVTCWFPAMEGLVKLSALTGDKKYLDAAMTIAKFYKSIDRIPLDHSHGMLCCQVSLLLLFEATKDASYLERVEKRWDELVQGGYINPAGGILEKCQVADGRDEGCAEADWLRLNLELGRVTRKSRYWDMAERVLNNQFLQNQATNGGFGHHNITCDKDGVRGFSGNILEATWCCDYHGQIGFVNLRSHLLERNAAGLTCNLALEFTAKGSAGTVKSTLSAGASAGKVMRQRIQLDGMPASVVRIRQPQWADSVTAIAADGSALPLIVKNGYCATKKPVASVDFVYAGGVYAEGRRCNRLPNGPIDGQPFALGFGPKIFAAANQSMTLLAWPTTVEALKAEGIELFSSALRGKDYRFVFDRKGPSALWIWFPDAGNSAENAPVGKRWFRRVIEIPAGRAIKLATVTMCADNEFTLFVNGRQVGAGSDWQKPVKVDIRSEVKPGPLVLAVEAVNTVYAKSNPAGLIGCVQVEFVDGSPMIHFTDGSWKTCDQEVPGWQAPGFNADAWKSARVLGRNGMLPWGGLAEFSWAEPARPKPFIRELTTGYLLQGSFLSPRPYCWPDDNTVMLSGWEVDKSAGYFDFHPTCRWHEGFAFHSDWFKLVDTSTNAAITLQHQIARQTEGQITLEFRFKLPERMDGACWQLRDLDQAGVSLVTSGSNLCWETGKVLLPYEANREYGVKAVADITAKSVDVYVDGELEAKGLPFVHPVKSLDYFLVKTGDAATGEMFLNPVNIYKGYAVNETFVTCGVGKIPADWEVTGGSVQVFECGTKPDIFSLKLTGEARKRFAPLHGRTVFECRFLLPGKTDGVRVELGGVDLTGVATYRSNLWYMAKVIADPATKTAEVFINGKPTAKKITFAKQVDAVHFAGNLWVDDVQVYPWRDYPADYVPEPKPVAASHLLGVQSCNLWREGTAYAGWDYVYPYRDKRKPYLGWYDEGNPEETDWEIKGQVEHGITFEQHCWYRPNNAINHPIKDGVLDQGIIKGLFNARYSHLKKFTIMCTDDGACETNPQDWRENIIPYWIEYFFKDPRYLKIDGKPVVSIYYLGNWQRMFGSVENCRQAITVLREECRQAGFPGVIVLMEHRSADRNVLQTMKAIGVDYCYAYTWSTPDVNAQRNNNVAQCDAAVAVGFNMLPSISMGWDREAWGVHDGGWVPMADYRALAQWTKTEFMPGLPADSLGRRLVMLANWNEFGEGHFLMPSTLAGFGYLDALREVFTDGGPHEDARPTDAQKHRFTTLFPKE